MNSTQIENSIEKEFGLGALLEYKAHLADTKKFRKCWVCSDLVPYRLYSSHLESCQPAGRISFPVNGSFISVVPSTNPYSGPCIPLIQVIKTSLFTHNTWPAGNDKHEIQTLLDCYGPTQANRFNIYAVSLNLGTNTLSQDRRAIYNKGSIELMFGSTTFYTGPTSSVLTQSSNLEDVDPRRRLTVGDRPIEIDVSQVLHTRLTGFKPRRPLELTIIFYGLRLKPVMS